MLHPLTTPSLTEIPSGLRPRPCPVCQDHTSEPHWRKGALHIVRCRTCGMIYVNPAPVAMTSGEFYDTEGAGYYLSPAKLSSDYAPVRFERELRLLREFCPRGAILDVGCGSGAFLYQLQHRWPGAYEILGTDVSGGPLDYAETRGVPVVRGNFLEQSFGGKPFDAITLWAVAEHLAEPQKFLMHIHALLQPGGWCFVLVPNLRSLAQRCLGVKYRYVYAQHLNYFSAPTLARLAAPHFRVVATRYLHFNPIVIWQDWRSDGREVSNAARGTLLKQTTALKQKPWLRPVRHLYGFAEKTLARFGLADNVVVVLQK